MGGFDPVLILRDPEFRGMLVRGFEMTIIVAACSWLLAISWGIILLLIRLTSSRVAGAAVAAYVASHRNVPTLVQLMLWYFGISSLLPSVVQDWLGDHNGEVIFAVISLGLCQAASARLHSG